MKAAMDVDRLLHRKNLFHVERAVRDLTPRQADIMTPIPQRSRAIIGGQKSDLVLRAVIGFSLDKDGARSDSERIVADRQLLGSRPLGLFG